MADKDITLMQVDGGNKWLPTTVTPVASALISFDASKVPVSLDTLTIGATSLTFKDAVNIVLNATTGTKIGTATTQKLGFWNAAPIAQPGATTKLNVVLSDAGLRAAGSAAPLDCGTITLDDAANIVTNATTGTKIGTATSQKIGFWNATPIVQPVGAGQGVVTDSSAGSGSTVPLIGNTTTVDQAANLNNAHFAILTLLHAIRTALVNAGIIKGAA